MRINGRTLRPSNLAERRFLLSLGTDALRVPRDLNPFAVARRLSRAAKGAPIDHDFARSLAARSKNNPFYVPAPSPDMDLPDPVAPDAHLRHGQAA